MHGTQEKYTRKHEKRYLLISKFSTYFHFVVYKNFFFFSTNLNIFRRTLFLDSCKSFALLPPTPMVILLKVSYFLFQKSWKGVLMRIMNYTPTISFLFFSPFPTWVISKHFPLSDSLCYFGDINSRTQSNVNFNTNIEISRHQMTTRKRYLAP